MRRTTAMDSAALALGTAASGVLVYVFFALATRALGARQAAPIAVLWTWWGVAASVLTFPLQHWIVRAVRADGEGRVRRALPRVWCAVGGLSAATAGAAWVARAPLFGRSDGVFPLLAGAVAIGACYVGVVRGGLAARGRFRATASALAGENALRAAGGALVAANGGGATEFALVLAAGPLVGALWPSSVRFVDEPGSSPASPLAFLSGIAGGSLIGQLVLTASPAVLSLLGGAPRDVTALFATLALFRAPQVVALGLVTQITGTLTSWVLSGGTTQLRGLLRWAAMATVLAALLGAVAGALAGPTLVSLIFGADVTVPASVAGAISAGSVVGLGNLLLTLVMLARERPGALLSCWTGALFVAGATLVVPLPPLLRVVMAFVLAECTAFLALAAVEYRASRSPSGATTAAQASPVLRPKVPTRRSVRKRLG